MIKFKTTREIINQTPKFDINDAKKKLDYDFNTKWYSEKELRVKLLDMYRFMCNEHGKANVWSMNADELLDNVDAFLLSILNNKLPQTTH